MKKFLSLILSVLFVLTLAACTDKEPSGAERDVDVEYYAKLGQIAGLDYKLGDSVDETKKALEAKIADNEEMFLQEIQIGDYTLMAIDDVTCCYKTADKAAGITHIIKHGDAYGFKGGDVSTQVRDIMTDIGYTSRERNAKSGELFFIPGADSLPLTVLEYQIKNTAVLFVFQENALSATVIFKK